MPVLQRVSVSVKNILLATDFSPVSEKAASYARALALNFRSAVEIAHVFDPSLVTSSLETVLGKTVKQRRRIATQSLDRLQKNFATAGVEARASMPEGHPPHVALLKAARQLDTDLPRGSLQDFGVHLRVQGGGVFAQTEQFRERTAHAKS